MKIMLRVLAIEGGIRRLDLNGHSLSLWFSDLHQKNPYAVIDLVVAHPQKFSMTPDSVLKARLEAGSVFGMLAETKNILKEIVQCVNA